MARFPYYQSNIKDLGRLIVRASKDSEFRKSLEQDPRAHLSSIGLPEQAVTLLNFKVVDQKSCPNAVALPFRLNSDKLEGNDESYLQSLGSAFALN